MWKTIIQSLVDVRDQSRRANPATVTKYNHYLKLYWAENYFTTDKISNSEVALKSQAICTL